MYKRAISITTIVAKNFVQRNASTVPTSSFLPTSEVSHRVTNVVKSIRSSESIGLDDNFSVDLGFDSLERKQLVAALANEFRVGLPQSNAENLISVNAAVKYFSEHPKAR